MICFPIGKVSNLLNLRLGQSACGVAPQSLTVINRTVLYCQEKSFVFKLRFFVMDTTIDETLTDSFWGTPTTRQLSKDISPDNWMAKCLLCDFPLLFIVQPSLFSFVLEKFPPRPLSSNIWLHDEISPLDFCLAGKEGKWTSTLST